MKFPLGRTNRLRWLTPLAGLALLTALLWPVSASAQEKQFALRFSSRAGDPSPRASLPLRPNLAQDFFVYVDNLNAQNAMLKVEVRAGGKAIDGGSANVVVMAADKITPVAFGKPPAPADKPVPPPAPPTPPVPAAFAEIKGDLQVVLLDMANAIVDEAALNVAQPKDYIQVTRISFDPNPSAGRKNQLRVEIKAKVDVFAGPRCRVDLVLDPQRIPNLADGKKFGTRGGFLAEAGSELILTADNLEFKDNKEENGFVALTIDGWERAILFSTSFPREGTVSSPEPVNTPLVRLLAPKQWNPAAPLAVKLEADNLGTQVVELGFDRDGDGKLSKLNGEILDFAGNRQQKLFFNPAYPGGALQLKPEVKDWATEVDVAEIFGPRTLRVRLLKNAEEALKPKDEERAIDLNLNKAYGNKDPLTELRQVVVLDGSPPENVKFVNLPKKLVRGESLAVSAVGVDPESGIKEVVFFLGKPGPDGKLLPNTVLVPGLLVDKDQGIWGAVLDAPTEQKGKFEVSVQFVNTANLVATETVKIELVDPAKEKEGVPGSGKGPAIKPSIEGKVIDGTGLPQGKGILVELRDVNNAVKDTTKTDDKSNYIFKDVIPGTYRVSSVRTGTNTAGSTVTQVKENEKKTDVDIKLSR